MKNKLRLCVLLVVVVCLFIGCSKAASSSEDEEITIYWTIEPDKPTYNINEQIIITMATPNISPEATAEWSYTLNRGGLSSLPNTVGNTFAITPKSAPFSLKVTGSITNFDVDSTTTIIDEYKVFNIIVPSINSVDDDDVDDDVGVHSYSVGDKEEELFNCLENGDYKVAIEKCDEFYEVSDKSALVNFLLGVDSVCKVLSNDATRTLIGKWEKRLEVGPFNIPLSIYDNIGKVWAINPDLAEARPKDEVTTELTNTYSEEFVAYIEAVIIPTLADADKYVSDMLNVVSQNVLIIPEKVCGIEGGLEIDEGDVCILASFVDLIEWGCHQLVAYDYTLASEDGLATKNILDKNPNFGRLRADNVGKQHMLDALAGLRGWASNLEKAINSVKDETDDQANDLISSDLLNDNTSKTYDVLKYLALIDRSLNHGGVYITEYINSSNDLTDISGKGFKVNLAALYENPIEDLRDYFFISKKQPRSKEEMKAYFPSEFDFTFSGLLPEITNVDELIDLVNGDTGFFFNLCNNLYIPYREYWYNRYYYYGVAIPDEVEENPSWYWYY
jgi:hypothetical protein